MTDQMEQHEQEVGAVVTAAIDAAMAPRILRLLNVVPVELAELLAEIEKQVEQGL